MDHHHHHRRDTNEQPAASPGSSSSQNDASSPSSKAAHHHLHRRMVPQPFRHRNRGRLLARLEHFTWANFMLPMATGSIALLLSEQTQPYAFRGMQTIGTVVYIFDLFLFVLVCACITTRFVVFPGTLRRSILDNPAESLFLGTSMLSVASIISGIALYGIPALMMEMDSSGGSSSSDSGSGSGGSGTGSSGAEWLITTHRILFWLYRSLAFLLAVFQYTTLFTLPPSRRLRIQDMTPLWDLPSFPFMLSSLVAGSGSRYQSPQNAVPIIFGGLMGPGLGFLVSMCIYATYVLRLFQYGFPAATIGSSSAASISRTRPGLFLAVGPPSFTGLAFIALAKDFPESYDAFGPSSSSSIATAVGVSGSSLSTRQILQTMAVATCLFILSLSLWFFCIAAAACVLVWRQLVRGGFRLSWYAFVFPNAGLTLAILAVGRTLDSPGVMWLGTVMTVLLVVVWIVVFVCHVRAVMRGDVVAEGKDEDVVIGEDKGDSNGRGAHRERNGDDEERDA